MNMVSGGWTPDGYIIKYGGSADLAEEVLSMGHAREKLSLPVPRNIAYPGSTRKRVPWTFPMPNCGPSGVWYICMEEVPGVALDKVINTLTEEQLDHIAVQLKSYIAPISSVKSKTLGSISGGPYRTFLGLIKLHQPKQVFTTMSEFYDHFRRLLLMCPGGEPAANKMLSPLPLHSTIHFTHGDLVPKNIMVDGSTITGIIDWANAGFYPEFWEYCRMYIYHDMTLGWLRMLKTVFPGERHQAEIDAFDDLVTTITYFV